MVVPTFTPSTQKDLKTAVKVLAHALSFAEASSCPLDACRCPLPTLYTKVEAHLLSHGKGPHTIRNTKNNLSRLFRGAQSQGLFSLAPTPATPQFTWHRRPPRPGYNGQSHDGSTLPAHHWPTPLRTAFEDFRQWATAPFADGRDARWRKRPMTIYSYQKAFETYFGFLVHIRRVQEPTFDHLFNLPLIQAFTNWYINVKLKRNSHTVKDLLKCVLTLTNQYRRNPHLHQQLKALDHTISQPTPVYNKDDAWVPLQQLAQIGRDLWPVTPPRIRPGHSGARVANHAGLSLMLQLWVYIPYRQRYIRELSLDDNLYRERGVWRIRFRGEQLKVATKRGRLNVFGLPFPEPLVPALETYLTAWRPLLTTDPAEHHLFLNPRGRPYSMAKLRGRLNRIVYTYTGKYWHPHIIRTTWATECIRSTGDFFTAAIMLNDTLEIVIKHYAHLREENIASKAYQWVHNDHS